jgi:hypothetical protein
VSISLRYGIVKRPAPHHNLGKPRVLSRLPVGFLSAMRRCGIPTPCRTSYSSCNVTRPFSFHVAREATLMLSKSGCCKILSATVYARDPRAYHHSSSLYSRLKNFFEFMSILEFPRNVASQVHLPFFLTRQYNFAMVNP